MVVLQALGFFRFMAGNLLGGSSTRFAEELT
jgi:hypothetical protein